MSNGISVDANVMQSFAKSYLRGEPSDPKTLVERIEEGPGFAIDEAGKIERQWLDTCGPKPGAPFFEWFYQGLKDGSIRKVNARLELGHKRRLPNDCGFPNDRFEMTYIEVANVTAQRYIVSEDIHFFEPRLKEAPECAKSAAKARRQGRVCRYLRRLGITVGTVAHALGEL